MSFELTPAKPAVTQTVTLKPAVPATVTATVSLHEALLLAAVQGASTGKCPLTFYEGLKDHALFAEYYVMIREAIAHDENYQRGNLSLAQVGTVLAELQRKSEEV